MRTAVDKQPSGRYRARYWDPTTNRPVPKTFDTAKAAKAWLAEVQVQMSQGAWVSPSTSDITLGAWVEKEFWATQQGLGKKTLYDERSRYRAHIEKPWGPRPLGSITSRQVAEWIGSLPTSTERGLKPNTVRLVYTTFKKILKTAADLKVIPAVPLPAKPGLPRIIGKPIRILTADEVSRLSDAISPRYRALVLLMAYGGFRIGEMAGLRRGKVDLETGTITIDDSQKIVGGKRIYGDGPKTANSVRTVTLPWPVVEELAMHVVTWMTDFHDPTALVFTPEDDEEMVPTNFRRHEWRLACEAVGLKNFTIHELRHTAVSTWISEGASPVLVAARAGDTVSTVMQVYAHLFRSDDEALRERLSDRYQNAAAAVRAAPASPLPVAVGDRTNVIPLRRTGR